ncbi:hypothetical protein [Lactobacillus mulieris]|uniref:Uncharacterized protein n=1 Tax=Lactobacillus mulieris TaxID=2508708 RepID=A0AAW5WWS8_9LACO|nr:hypothetical protein [Lactobacillus mulieris]MCZ3621396.1 hypothetical protein [Lactobacillus mulieris]MCZ3623328.1 hypothetical protein [Lactobacillus mulieris]MCZ3635403.1 hypothetical protein [Lactobacillus mulieris]MCZ3689489.1 hypothetical protein [Lactobacillus mulieris]MCZ3695492.1 hypothetical protein [Lactobacillus mulieris]
MRKAEIDEYIQNEIKKPPRCAQEVCDPFLASLSDEEMKYLEKRILQLSKTWDDHTLYMGA